MNKKPLLNLAIPGGEEQRVESILSQVEQALGFVPDGMRLYGLSLHFSPDVTDRAPQI